MKFFSPAKQSFVLFFLSTSLFTFSLQAWGIDWNKCAYATGWPLGYNSGAHPKTAEFDDNSDGIIDSKIDYQYDSNIKTWLFGYYTKDSNGKFTLAYSTTVEPSKSNPNVFFLKGESQTPCVVYFLDSQSRIEEIYRSHSSTPPSDACDPKNAVGVSKYKYIGNAQQASEISHFTKYSQTTKKFLNDFDFANPYKIERFDYNKMGEITFHESISLENGKTTERDTKLLNFSSNTGLLSFASYLDGHVNLYTPTHTLTIFDFSYQNGRLSKVKVDAHGSYAKSWSEKTMYQFEYDEPSQTVTRTRMDSQDGGATWTLATKAPNIDIVKAQCNQDGNPTKIERTSYFSAADAPSSVEVRTIHYTY